MIDSRYPNIVELSRASAVPQRLVRVARSIASRTNTSVAWNRRTSQFWFYYAEPDSCVFACKASPGPGYFLREEDEDDIVRLIGMGRMKRSHKDRITAANQAAEEHEREESVGRTFGDREHDIESYAAFLDRRRRGVGTLISL